MQIHMYMYIMYYYIIGIGWNASCELGDCLAST